MSHQGRIHLDDFNIQTLISQLKQYGQLSMPTMVDLLQRMKFLLENEPNVLQISSPLLIVADIHGQFYDLLNIFQKIGDPEQRQYLFLGDYVDRGSFCIEVITLLFMLKLRSPHLIHLLRGNHESRVLTNAFNFKKQCIGKFNASVYDRIMGVFDMLPLCAIIDHSFFAVHGGISPHLSHVSQLQKVNRFQEVPAKGLLCDLLWSDPLNDLECKWRSNLMRQCSFFFGVHHSRSFLNKNSLKMIIRGHEVTDQGFKYQKYLSNLLTLTIFSAPNYADYYHNKGCVAEIKNNTVQIHSFSQVEHPNIFPTSHNAIQLTLPILQSCFSQIFSNLIKIKSKNMSDKLKKILNSKEAFEEELKIMQRIEVLNKILLLKEASKVDPNQHEKDKTGEDKQQNKQNLQFEQLKVRDMHERMPLLDMPELNVIGPKISQKICFIKQFALEQDSIREERPFQ